MALLTEQYADWVVDTQFWYTYLFEKQKNIHGQQYQTQILSHYRNLLSQYFFWENLPSELVSEDLNMILFEYGAGAFFKDQKTQKYYFMPFVAQEIDSQTSQPRKITIRPLALKGNVPTVFQGAVFEFKKHQINTDANFIPIQLNYLGQSIHQMASSLFDQVHANFESLRTNLNGSIGAYVFTSNPASKDNKDKQGIIAQANQRMYQSQDVINTGTGNFKDKVKSVGNATRRDPFPDVSTSIIFQTEKAISQIDSILGIPSNMGVKKGAQETDSQIFNQSLKMILVQNAFLNTVNRNLKKINSTFGQKIKVKINPLFAQMQKPNETSEIKEKDNVNQPN